MTFKIIWQDVALLSAIALYVFVGVMTKYTYYQVAAVTQLAETATYMEANPAARKIIDMKYGIIISQVVATGILLGAYVTCRANRLASMETMLIFNCYTMAIVWLFTWNFLNDLPVYLQVLRSVRGGG